MSRVFSGLCALVVLLVLSEEAFCHWHGRGGHNHRHNHHHGHHGHRHRQHHRQPSIIVLILDIYKPKGMEVSVPRPNSTAQYFSMQMTINNPESDTPDVVLNTTDVVYGKFIVRDTEVILKPGDSLNTTYEIGFSEGGVIRYNTKMVVNEYMIQKKCSCETETPSETFTKRPIVTVPPWERSTTVPTPPRYIPTAPATTTATIEETTDSWNDGQMDYSSELFGCEIDPTTNRCLSSSMVDERFSGSDHPRVAKFVVQSSRYPDLTTLENVFKMVNGQCVSKPRTNYLTLKSPGRPFTSSNELEAYVRSILKQSPKLTEMADKGLRSARPNGKVIVFEMNTLINKLQLLYLAQESGLTVVKDYD